MESLIYIRNFYPHCLGLLFSCHLPQKTPRLLHHTLPTPNNILPPRTLRSDRPSDAEEVTGKKRLGEHDILPPVDAIVKLPVQLVELDLVGDSWRVKTEDDEG